MRAATLALILVPLLGACATTYTGVGYGTRPGPGGEELRFEWSSRNSVEGTLKAIVPGGKSFVGSYFQITSETRIERLDPLWAGWQDGWHGWRHWHAQPSPEFIRHYSGRVLANLAAADGERMRCRLRLVAPSAGLRGGAQGRCQAADGRRIDVNFPQG